MKPLKGYKNVTNFYLKPQCNEKDCPRDGEIPTHYDEESGEFTGWKCPQHAYKYFAKSGGKK